MPKGPSTPDILGPGYSESHILFFPCSLPAWQNLHLWYVASWAPISSPDNEHFIISLLRQWAFHYKFTYSLLPVPSFPRFCSISPWLPFLPSFNVPLASLSHTRTCVKPCRYSNGWDQGPRGVCSLMEAWVNSFLYRQPCAVIKVNRGHCRRNMKGFLNSEGRT